MKHRLKGLFALVLSLVTVFALATNAWAEVRVGGHTFNETNGYTVSGDQGTATYDSATNTLTLNNFTMVDNSHYEAISSDQDLTLNLIGDNEITASYGSGAVAVSVTGRLAIEGTGSLTASGTNEGIHADNVAIESGKVTATGVYDGISAEDVTISGGEVNAKGTGEYGDGISAEDVTISGGKVSATGVYDGISANKVTISGGTVTATGSNDYGYGIYALEDNFNGGDITISNGTVTATGGIAGMYADNKVTIEGGTVTATGGSAGAGIGADNAITISGADTNVTVGCETGLVADTVNIAGGSTVSIDADKTAIDCTTLNMGGNWYQWKGDDNQLHVSSDGDEHKLNATKAAATKTLIIEKISTGSAPGNTNPYPPIIYNPTPTPEPEVTAPNTFDGGIASAVVVTILSATGGAWLAKKKD